MSTTDRIEGPSTPEHRRLISTDVPGVYRRGSRFIAQTRHPRTGKIVKTSHKTKGEAKKAKAQRDAGKLPVSTERFDSYAERWIVNYKGRTARGLAPSTRDDYAYQLREYVIPYFKTMKLGEIGRADLKEFVEHLSKLTVKTRSKNVDGKIVSTRDPDGRKLRPSSIRRIMCPLKALLNEAYEDELIDRDAGNVRIIVRDERGQRVDQPRIKSMTREQIGAVLGAIPEPDRLLFIFLAKTGVRISEALGAQWQDIEHRDDGPVFVISRQHYRGELREETKTEAGERAVALMPSLMHDLMRHRSTSAYGDPAHPIFATLTGSHMDAHNVRRRMLKPAATRAGVPWVTPHVFRHSLARELREQGYHDGAIAAILGHSDPNFTRKTYGRLTGAEAVRFDDVDGLVRIAAVDG